jgi:peroxiredoxin family protein
MRLSLTHLAQLRKSDLENLLMLGGWTMENFINWVSRSRNEAALVHADVTRVMEAANYGQLCKKYRHLDAQLNDKKHQAKEVIAACDSIIKVLDYKQVECYYPITKSRLADLINEIDLTPAAE